MFIIIEHFNGKFVYSLRFTEKYWTQSHINGSVSLMQLVTIFYGSTFFLDTANLSDIFLDINTSDTVRFSRIITSVLVSLFQSLHVLISDKSDKFLLKYSNLFWGSLFIRRQCMSVNIREYLRNKLLNRLTTTDNSSRAIMSNKVSVLNVRHRATITECTNER